MDNKEFSAQFQQRIYRFVLDLIFFLDTLPRNDMVCTVIRGQLIRSGSSIGANYIEATAASSRKDFTNFLHHALKSANESRFWLCLLRDSKRASISQVSVLLVEVEAISKILASSILTLKGRKKL